MLKSLLTISLVFFACGWASAQSFETASIKPSKAAGEGMHMQSNAGGLYTAENITLKNLIMQAYDVREHQLAGLPDWIGSQRYDITARPESYAETRKVDNTQMKTMLQAMLAERCRLAVHRETKEGPVYSLVVAKGGPKLQDAGPDKKGVGMSAGRGMLQGHENTTAMIARALSDRVARTIVDNTGLTGNYNFTLKWMPDADKAPGLGLPEPSATADGPSLFTAIQEQLGLKLEPAKGPVEILVIDHVEKPSDN
jgi:bla regulator protein blaR1